MPFYLWFALGGALVAACAGAVVWYCSDAAVKRRQHQRLQDERVAAALRLIAEDELD